MKAELRHLHSPDVADLRSWRPQGEDFAILVQLMVGPEDAPGEEAFNVTVCSAGWLAQSVSKLGILNLAYHVLVASYDYDQLETYFRRVVSTCSGSSWAEVARCLAKIGRWEFDDFSD